MSKIRRYPLTDAQARKLYKMREHGLRLHHFFNDNRFSHGCHRSVDQRIARELIVSGELVCVERNPYSNVWATREKTERTKP